MHLKDFIQHVEKIGADVGVVTDALTSAEHDAAKIAQSSEGQDIKAQALAAGNAIVDAYKNLAAALKDLE